MQTKTKEVRDLLTEHNLQHSVWGKRIIKACETGEFTHVEKFKAGKWVTCACGESSVNIPTDDGGVPLDRELKRLGDYFPEVVCYEHPMKAAEVLIAIEKRAIEVANRSSLR